MVKNSKASEIRAIRKRIAEENEENYPTQVSYTLSSAEEYIGYFLFSVDALFIEHKLSAEKKMVFPKPKRKSFYFQVFRDRNLPVKVYHKKLNTLIEEENLLHEFILDENDSFQESIQGMLLFISR